MRCFLIFSHLSILILSLFCIPHLVISPTTSSKVWLYGKDILTGYSARYDDNYVLQNGKWLIKERIAHFLIIESRTL